LRVFAICPRPGRGINGNPADLRDESLLAHYINIMKEIIYSKNQKIRLDKFLKEEFFFYEPVSRGELIRAIKSGEIQVNGKKIKPSYQLRENDKIALPENLQNLSNEKQEVMPNAELELDIIFQDDNIIVINKPAGIQVHPDANEKENTIANALVAIYPKIKDVHDDSPGSYLRPGIVHRLDKNTSGVLVAAKNIETFERLKNLFQNRRIQKKYIALVSGTLRDKRGIITKPIARAGNYRKQVIAGSKTKTKVRGAVTIYKVIKEYKNYSLLEVKPETGRMHQIRIHLFSIGHPVVGDELYRLKGANLQKGLSRHLLHAESLFFCLDGEKFRFHVKLPGDFQQFIDTLDV
jgi:23S rRNA pseudouridine1911/1915/1917 synthase